MIRDRLNFLIFSLYLVSFANYLNARPGDLPDDLGFVQKLGEQVNLSTRFRDSTDLDVEFGKLLNSKPLVVIPVFFTCEELCDITTKNFLTTLKEIDYRVGRDFGVAFVSIDPKDTPQMAAHRKSEILATMNSKTSDGWHVLTGEAEKIALLMDEIGFHYSYDESAKSFQHPSGLVVLSASGKISSYLYGIDFEPRDLKFALIQASKNEIGSLVDRMVMLCYHYDPETGTYSVAIMKVTRWLGVILALCLVILIFMLIRLSKLKKAG